MAFAYFIALINHLIIGYKLPDGPLASKNQHNLQNQKYISSVFQSSSLLEWTTVHAYIYKYTKKLGIFSWSRDHSSLKKSTETSWSSAQPKSQ